MKDRLGACISSSSATLRRTSDVRIEVLSESLQSHVNQDVDMPQLYGRAYTRVATDILALTVHIRIWLVVLGDRPKGRARGGGLRWPAEAEWGQGGCAAAHQGGLHP